MPRRGARWSIGWKSGPEAAARPLPAGNYIFGRGNFAVPRFVRSLIPFGTRSSLMKKSILAAVLIAVLAPIAPAAAQPGRSDRDRREDARRDRDDADGDHARGGVHVHEWLTAGS